MTKYKRNFGPVENNPAPAAVGNQCQFCGKNGRCAVPVFIREEPTAPAQVVCYKVVCVFCGNIQQVADTDKDGKTVRRPAFFAYGTGRGILTTLRNFFLPPDLYATPDGKADVGLKVRLIRALLRLQVARPTEREFGLREVYEEYKKENQ